MDSAKKLGACWREVEGAITVVEESMNTMTNEMNVRFQKREEKSSELMNSLRNEMKGGFQKIEEMLSELKGMINESAAEKSRFDTTTSSRQKKPVV